jgi:hypothetical protein
MQLFLIEERVFGTSDRVRVVGGPAFAYSVEDHLLSRSIVAPNTL